MEADGFVVMRSAGSKGAFDLIAVNDKVCFHIQLKATNNPKTTYDEEASLLKRIKVPMTCSKRLWVYCRGKFLKAYDCDENAL